MTLDRSLPPRLIINQQHLRTEWSGGAGAYAEELVARLDRSFAPGGTAPLGASNLYVLHRPEEWDPVPASAPVSVPRGTHMRRFAAHWMLPPGFHRAARNTYRWMRTPRLSAPSEPPSSASPSLPAPCPAPVELPWDTEAPCIFHELTSYEAHPLVGHACTNPNLRLCVTFLDLQDFYYPSFFSPEAISQRRRNYAFYKQHASLFFAISEFTKKTMVELLGIDPERIIVTHLAGDEIPAVASHSDAEFEAEAAARAHGRYLIYPAKLWQHKNHATLIDAMGMAAAAAREAGLRLLLTSSMSDSEKAALMEHAHAAGAGDLVKILGFCSRISLQALLRNAEMMIFPSLFEGFGMPVLEAQALGCPVACSDAASLPEIAGDGALVFDPLDAASIAQVIADVALRRIDRAVLKDKGFRNIRRFSWDATYRATVDGYERLLAQRGAG